MTTPRRSTALLAGLSLAAMLAAGTAFVMNQVRAAPRTVAAETPRFLLPEGSVIAAEGDSLTYGMDATPEGGRPAINGAPFPRSIAPFPETLATMLGGGCPAINRGFPGDRSVDGLVRWQDAPATELTILMYGSNDALNNGNASSGIVSVETFRFTLTELIERRRRAGSQILLVVPPPIGDGATDKRIDPYRDAVRAIAERLQLPLIDAVAELADIDPPWTKDWVHLSARANRRLAEAIAGIIQCG